MASKREVWFVAECEDTDGSSADITVIRDGGVIHLAPSRMGWAFKTCHHLTSTEAHVISEIEMICEVKVKNTVDRFERTRQVNARATQPAATPAVSIPAPGEDAGAPPLPSTD